MAERRDGYAPEAAFKVGESTQEISCNYFGEVLGFSDHLENEHIRKCGLRFWFPAGDNTDVTQRIERGPSGKTSPATSSTAAGSRTSSDAGPRGRDRPVRRRNRRGRRARGRVPRGHVHAGRRDHDDARALARRRK